MKTKIQDKEGTPKDKQILLSGFGLHQEMMDDEKMSDYNIQEG